MAATTVFISHSRGSAPQAEKLSRALQSEGFPTWLDSQDLKPGEHWETAIDRSLRAANAIVFLVGPADERRDLLRHEWSHALEAAWDQPQKQMIPVILDDAAVPAFLQKQRAIHLGPRTEDWKHALDLLLTMLRRGTNQAEGWEREDGTTPEPALDRERMLGRAMDQRSERLREVGVAANALRSIEEREDLARDESG